ncbi:flagellin [Haliovirga abyssi]|uniref:Flagellin n=1 Tax=Haliovirga abyssi TaxID=2996794 RepID=A0AAU9D8J9_9FUSO|nr:flagellin [Haliovirga abyssi]BDU49911.1 flagellin [Haliovirga abyssi]
MKISGAYGGALYNILADKDKSMKELSSGKKLNSASDDAAGLGISKKLEAQSKEFAAKIKNYQTQMSFYQVGDSALEQTTDNLNKLRELAVQYNNDTLSDSDKNIIKEQAKQILEDIDTTANSTEFNSKKVVEDFSSNNLGIEKKSLFSEGFLKKLDEALQKVTDKRSEFGSEVNKLQSEVARTRVAHENSVAANSRIEDTDMLASMLNNTKSQILEQSNLAVTAQANLSQQRILDILKD